MPKAKNDFVKIELIDNTKSNEVLELVEVKGYSKQSMPSQGKINGKDIYFYNYGVYKLGDLYFIPEGNIFCFNGFLCKSGVIAKAKTYHQKMAGLDIRKQDFFTAIDSNIFEVPKNSAIIIRPHSGYSFNMDGKPHSFIEPQNILLVVSKTIKPGPEFVMLKQTKEDNIFEQDKEGSGLDGDGTIKHFTKAESMITLKDSTYHLVRRGDVYGEN